MITIGPEYVTPHSLGHEKRVLSCLMNWMELFDECPGLTEEHFHMPGHKEMFLKLLEDSKRIQSGGNDLVTFFEECRLSGKLDRMGGIAGITEIYSYARANPTFASDLAKLNQYHGRRLAITAGLELVKEALEGDTAEDLLRAAGDPITAIHEAFSADGPQQTTKNVLGECVSAYEERLKGTLSPMGIPTIPEIDQLIRGLHQGRVVVIGAYSGGGKSVLSSQIISLTALDGIPVLEINYEMQAKDSMDRKIIQMSGVPSMAFMDPIQYGKDNNVPPTNEGFMRALKRTIPALLECPMTIKQQANTQLLTLLAMIRKAVRETGVKVVAIDYLQKIRSRGAATKEAEMTEVSNSIQEIAGELGISVLLLSQLNENGDTKHGIVAVEDCDAYLIIEQERDKKAENFGQHYGIQLAKDRFCGNQGKIIPLIFDPERVKFVHGFVDRKKKSGNKPTNF